MSEIDTSKVVSIDYTNHRGDRGRRLIVPIELTYCPNGTEFHPKAGWYLRALDVTKNGERDFAMADVHSWLSI